MLKIFITGICGFAGSTLAWSLKERLQHVEITGIDNFSRAGSWTHLPMLQKLGISVVSGDVRQSSDLERFDAFDWVIDAAAIPSVSAGTKAGGLTSRQLMEHNLMGTVNLLEFCKSRGAGFVLPSTSRVYSISALNGLPLRDNGTRFEWVGSDSTAGCSKAGLAETFSTDAPVSLYGATKLASESLALEYGAAFKFPVWINRCGILAGAGQFGRPDQGIISYWIHSWAQRRPLRYIGFQGKGAQVRDCLHPSDLADLMLLQWKCSDPKQPRICNAAGGADHSFSLAELSAWCERRFHPHSVSSDLTTQAFDVPWLILDCDKAMRFWNWQPKITTATIFEEIAIHAGRHPEWIDLSSSL